MPHCLSTTNEALCTISCDWYIYLCMFIRHTQQNDRDRRVPTNAKKTHLTSDVAWSGSKAWTYMFKVLAEFEGCGILLIICIKRPLCHCSCSYFNYCADLHTVTSVEFFIETWSLRIYSLVRMANWNLPTLVRSWLKAMCILLSLISLLFVSTKLSVIAQINTLS